MNFQRIVLTIAIVLLVISLIFIGLSINGSKKNRKFPPVVANCPDYFDDKGTNSKSLCKNTKSLGICSDKIPDFNTSEYIGQNGMCNKKKWAKSCNVTWDGITNNLNACSAIKTNNDNKVFKADLL
jgi:hypothetical protein